MIDDQGCYVFIKGTLKVTPITLAYIYSPNVSQVPLFRSISLFLATFRKGMLIIGGDFIVPLDALLDTSSGTSYLPYRAIKQIKLSLQELILHDTWGTPSPNWKILHLLFCSAQ